MGILRGTWIPSNIPPAFPDGPWRDSPRFFGSDSSAPPRLTSPPRSQNHRSSTILDDPWRAASASRSHTSSGQCNDIHRHQNEWLDRLSCFWQTTSTTSTTPTTSQTPLSFSTAGANFSILPTPSSLLPPTFISASDSQNQDRSGTRVCVCVCV